MKNAPGMTATPLTETGDRQMKFDRENLMTPLPRAAKKLLLATASLVVVGHAAALAQGQTGGPVAPLQFRNDYFGYGLAVGPRVSYTDNIALAPSGFHDDELAGGVAVNGSAIYSNNRFTGIIDGALDGSYLTDQAEFVVSQDVSGVGTFTVSDNLFYVDVGASSTRQLAGEDARFSQNVNAGRNQRVNVHNFAVSPYLNRRFANGSAAELRYRFGQVFIDPNTANVNPNNVNGGISREARTQEIIANYNSGQAFGRLDANLTAYGNKTDEQSSGILGDYEFEQGTLQGDFQFSLTDRFALAGTIGYDEVDTTAPATFFPEDRLTGVFWNAGFRAKPGPKTDILLKYGRRYDGEFINGSLSYDISQRLRFNASADRTFTSSSSSSANRYQALQRTTLDFVERLRTGGASDPTGVLDALTRVSRQRIGAQQIGLGVANDVSAGLSAAYGRTTFGLNANYHDVDYGFRQLETIGAGISAQRQISRKLSAYGDVFYRRVDATADLTGCLADPASFGFDITVPGFDPAQACSSLIGFQGNFGTVGGRLGVAYRLYQNVSAYGEYGHTERFSQNALQEYSENTVTAGLQVEF